MKRFKNLLPRTLLSVTLSVLLLGAPATPLVRGINPDGPLNFASGFVGSVDQHAWAMAEAAGGKPPLYIARWIGP